jgi:thiamine kinase-like enzyme
VTPKTAKNMRIFQAVAAGETPPFPLPPWIAGRWDELADLECGIDHVMTSQQVSHGDLRPDNLVIGADRAWICDWSKPRFMPQWVDTVCLLSVAHGDGHDAERLFWAHPTAKDVAAEQLDTLLAAITGGMLRGWPEAPSRIVSPSIQEHMRWNGLAASDWLATRCGWIR